MEKAYEPQKFEDEIYKKWEVKELFNPDKVKELRAVGRDSFSIVLPPPNVTGTLHLGHAAMLAIEDLMIRYHRMKGFDTVWIPGTDHAAIATQNVVEKKILKETGKTRHDLGRERFLAEVEKFVIQSKDTIHKQVRKMGSSLDWSREGYTLDETRSRAVRKVFKMMYDDGLIYRGYRIVNWCPRCQSTLADDEVEYKDESTKLYYFKYDKNFPITIATTRPETKLGDTAVAVNPDDERYKKYVGQTFDVDFVGVPLKIKVIADKAVDPAFGTGALGVTPAHSMVDYEMAQKNNLPIIKVIDEEGKMTDKVGDFSGMTAIEAREAVVKALEKAGLQEKVEDAEHKLSSCYRCGTAVEPLPSEQWFVSVDKKVKRIGGQSLKEKAIEVIKNKKIEIIPERFEKVYLNWMENLHDWCISRQIWFGHRIPVWYKGEARGKRQEAEVYVGEEAPEGAGWVQDEDTLDTWFSSGLWTFTTLLKKDFKDFEKKHNSDLKRFHPISVMETAYDILFFWVARMILMTNYVMEEIPFEKVYFHGLVRDKEGKKMSKSRPETAIDPIIVGDKYGYDAVRLSFLIGATPGNDVRLYEEKIEGFRNFVNKLWNISRFIISQTQGKTEVKKVKPKTLADKWILSRLNTVIKEVTESLDSYQFSAAGEKLRDFTYNELADWYLEVAKVEKGKDEILAHILDSVLRLWHPFVPFVTEAIFSETSKTSIMIQDWPKVSKRLIDDQAEKEFVKIKEVITAIRNLRAENNVEPAKKIKAQFVCQKKLKEDEAIIKALARLDSIEYVDVAEKPAASGVVEDIEIYLPLKGLIDIEKEKSRLEKEIENVKKYVDSQEKKLGNDEFVKNAPANVVEGEKAKLAEAKEKLEKLNNQLEGLK
ncbi:MAG: valine--tRNA ligase [Patescibacteria group bacterium]